jgi:endonuclease/exonuclease/phosphatase family metal-dependent hydrolase
MLKKIIRWTLITVAGLLILFFAFVWFASFHPKDVQKQEVVCSEKAPALQPGDKIKVLNWNVQYMASKNYVFFYDKLDGSGPDERPSPEDITWTIKEVARVIKAEDPDIVLLQEVDDGSKRTDYEDQLQRLMKHLPQAYQCHSEAFYHKADFVPHPRIMGAVGMKMVTLSKYRLEKARRYQLPLMPGMYVTQQFNLKRAVLETRIPIKGKKDLVVFNTHLDAFSQGTNTMEKQVSKVRRLLKGVQRKGHPWLIGGDFNLLPPGGYDRLPAKYQVYYKPKTELKKLLKDFAVIPPLAEMTGDNPAPWFTHLPNSGDKLDRTIDYIFYSRKLSVQGARVRQHDTQKISDHMPVIAEFDL